MNNIATLFDSNYLPRALAMMKSLEKVCKDLKYFVLCLDNGVGDLLNKAGVKHLELITTSMLEEEFPDLLTAKTNRSKVEYIFTLSPFLPLYILKKFGVDRVTSMDADLLFYANPFKYFEGFDANSIFITPHSFDDHSKDDIIFGRYNVSFQSFPNTENGIACLQDWGKNCLDYCGDTIDDLGRYADQKYLDEWPDKFQHVQDLPVPGYGVAPWNASKLGKSDLVFYHFQGFKPMNGKFFVPDVLKCGIDLRERKYKRVKKIYADYFREIIKYAMSGNNDTQFSRGKISGETKFGIPKAVMHHHFGFSLGGAIFYSSPIIWYKRIMQSLKKNG